MPGQQSSSDFSWSALEEGREKRTNAETGEEERGDRCRLTERKCETERWERAVINIHQGDKGPDCNSVAVQYFVLMFGVLGFLPVPYAIKCLCVENLQSGVSVHFQTNSVQVRFKWVGKQGDRAAVLYCGRLMLCEKLLNLLTDHYLSNTKKYPPIRAIYSLYLPFSSVLLEC